ncbi:MAG: hypothetical protein ACREJ2_04660, partial [Planctomycetota bacterium]
MSASQVTRIRTQAVSFPGLTADFPLSARMIEKNRLISDWKRARKRGPVKQTNARAKGDHGGARPVNSSTEAGSVPAA